MKIEKENKIGEVVSDNFRTAQVFESLGLDFCCGGKKTINDACLEKGLEPSSVIAQLTAVENNTAIAQDFNNWEVDFLVDYIINKHHGYVKKSVPVITRHLEKVVMAHGTNHPEVIRIKTLFDEVKTELIQHMNKEEMMLFPFIKSMKLAIQHSTKINHPPFGSVAFPISIMENEHEEAGELLAEIKMLSNGYEAPKNACNTFKVLYGELKEFEQDLHQHVHLENNILFPKASEMEKELNSDALVN